MVKLIFQSLVKYSINTEDGRIEILSKFTTPVKEARNSKYAKAPKKVVEATVEVGEVLF